jgi:hypothetical protein
MVAGIFEALIIVFPLVLITTSGRLVELIPETWENAGLTRKDITMAHSKREIIFKRIS